MEKINIAELLKDCPKGMELDCTMYDKVTLLHVDDKADIVFPIRVLREDGNSIALTKYGQCTDADFAKCVIFPKGKTTWEGFQIPFKDGDIVAIGEKLSAQVFIFKEYITAKVNQARCYMMLDVDGTLNIEGGNYYVSRLADEEEKEKLFQTIKDNGYKWNAETNTLEKLFKPKFKLGDNIRIKGESVIHVVTEVRENLYILDTKDISLPVKIQDQSQWELVPNKFDITTLKPFDEVLVRNTNNGRWRGQFYMSYDKNEEYPFECAYKCWKQCIPYENNEHLFNKTYDCDEYYKTWK